MDLICDLDGTVWSAGEVFPGVADAIARARAAGHRFLFATNNAIPTLEQLRADLARQGIPSDEGLVSSATATATLMESGQRVYVIGGPGLRAEISARQAIVIDPEPGMLGRQLAVDFVAVGRDTEFDFAALTIATDAILAGATFLAVCTDPTHPGPYGIEPGGGAIVAAIAAATGADPIVAGKPNTAMAEALIEALGEDELSDAMVIGDVIGSDGQLAAEMGLPFALVLSGATKEVPPGAVHPLHIATDLVRLIDSVLV